MKAAFYTLGCKVNQYESQAMGEFLRKTDLKQSRTPKKPTYI